MHDLPLHFARVAAILLVLVCGSACDGGPSPMPSDGGTSDGSHVDASHDLTDAATEQSWVGSDEDELHIGHPGIDRLRARGGMDVLRGEAGNDELHGEDGSDMLLGGPGDDLLVGETGHDVLNGGEDDDQLEGGSGADLYVWQRGGGFDVIDDEEGGFDRLVFADVAESDVTQTREGEDLVIHVGPDEGVRIVMHGGRGAMEAIEFLADRSWRTSADFAIRWYGEDRTTFERHIPTVPNRFFDPNRPTLLFVHGWSPETSAPGTFDMTVRDAPPDLDVVRLWRDAGWNIGMFNWETLSHEEDVDDAEAKIWSTAGPRGMRRQGLDGQFGQGPPIPMGEVLGLAITHSLMELGIATEAHVPFWLTGHSLGNQLATRTAGLMLEARGRGEISSRVFPERIALFDPYWSSAGQDYLDGETTGERASTFIHLLKQDGIAIESIRSSVIYWFPGTDGNAPLLADTCHLFLDADYLDLPFGMEEREFASKHWVAVWYYFALMGRAEPLHDELGADICGPRTSNDRIRTWMRSEFEFEQIDGEAGGSETYTMDDDAFARIRR